MLVLLRELAVKSNPIPVKEPVKIGDIPVKAFHRTSSELQYRWRSKVIHRRKKQKARGSKGTGLASPP